MRILNPYENIDSMVRHRAISHEHTYVDTTPTNQSLFERCINRGIDVFCGVSYQPSVPQVPLTGWSWRYEDWEFQLDDNGNIIYELDRQGNIKYKTFNGVDYPIPSLLRVTKTCIGSRHDFEMEDGNMSDIANMVQLPNSEHAFFVYPSGEMRAGTHLNFIGSTWGDAVNGFLTNLDKYNLENGLNLRSGGFRQIFPLWTLEQVIDNVRNNLQFSNKVFGTINHPGYSSLKDYEVDLFMNMAPDLFKAMEIYNHGDSEVQANYDISFYDKTLMRGYRLWCVSVNDWGTTVDGYHYASGGTNRGCNLLYLPSSYESLSQSEKAEAALDAYIAGSFSAVGFGNVDIEDVAVNGNLVDVTFNDVMDSIIVDIDGKRSAYHNTSRIFANLRQTNTFVRFEAYKGNDFIFTQPFFVLDKTKGLNISEISILFDEK